MKYGVLMAESTMRTVFQDMTLHSLVKGACGVFDYILYYLRRQYSSIKPYLHLNVPTKNDQATS
jgi:hypothetical protein